MDQQTLDDEMIARDRALDLLETYRADIVDVARNVAIEICTRKGRVTSPEVLHQLNEIGFSEVLKVIDPRFMGAVFRAGWERIGLENKGSHGRAVSIWRRKQIA